MRLAWRIYFCITFSAISWMMIVVFVLSKPRPGSLTPVYISVDDSPIFKAFIDTSANPDETWQDLRDAVFFHVLKDFENDQEMLVLESKLHPGSKGVLISAREGGSCRVEKLTLQNVDSGHWRIDPDELDNLFLKRFVSRKLASHVK